MYENMRTRLGKILKKGTKSGSGQASRTVRDEEIVSTWEFLKKHIVRGETVASDKFDSPGTPESDRVYVVEEQGHDVSSEGSEDLPLFCEKGHVKKYKRPETLSTASRSTSGTRTPVSGPVMQSNLNEPLQQVLSKADTLAKTAALSGQRKIVNDFACLLECHMQKIPEENWERFEIECLTLIHRFKQPSQYPWQKQQQQPVSWPQSPSQEWPPASHWSRYAQWPANQISYSQLMPAAPSAVAVRRPSNEFHHPPATATFRHSKEKLQESERLFY